jgi:hypothetical protein
MRRRRNPEIIAGRVAANGDVLAGEGFTVSRAQGTGIYVLTFAPGFRLVAVTATPTPWGWCATDSWADRSLRVLTSPNGAALGDNSFAFVAVGQP